jgi:uncharacterized cupin superfamily protein
MKKGALVNPVPALAEHVLNVADLDALDLEPWPLPNTEALKIESIDGKPVEYSGRLVYLSDDRRIAVGIERLGPSLLTGTHAGETLHFLQGRIEARPPGAEPYELRAGDVCYFEPGMPDVWEIKETYVKLFVFHSPDPLPFGD